MSQHDFNIANQTFPNFRADLNNALVAAATMSAGSSAPTTPYAYQLWFDTTTGTWKVRNSGNTAWVSTITTDLATGNVGIGTSSPSGSLHLLTPAGSSGNENTKIPLVVQENSFSSANLLELRNSVGGALSAFDQSGSLGIGTSSIPTGKLAVEGGIYLSGSSNFLRFGADSSTTTGVAIHRPAANTIAFVTNSAERARVTDNGITFNGDTAAANALNDYEEADWSPILNDSLSGNLTIAIEHAKVTKIGNLVNLDFYVRRNDSRSLTGTLYLHNLPYATQNNSARLCGSAWFDNSSNDWRTFIYAGGNGTNVGYFTIPGNSNAYITSNQWENNRYIYGSLTYKTN